MRVLHVIPAVGQAYGGPSVAIRGMTRSLAARGVEVEVATTDANGGNPLDVPLGSPVHDGDVTYRFFARSLPGEWKYSWPLTRWLARRVSDFDIVHVHALFSYSTIPACRFARRAGVPYVVRPLGTLAPWSLGQGAWKKQPYMRFVERPHLRSAAAIHVTSKAEESDVRALGFSRVAMIPLGVGPSLLSGRGSRREGERPLRLLFLSRLHPKKNIPLLLDACALLERARPGSFELVIAGAGDASYRAALESQARREGIGARVTFAGHLEGDAKADAFAGADVFVLPSSDENFGIAAAEALAAGLPTILSDQVALAADVADAGAGLVAARDPASLATAIESLAEDPIARARMGRAARELARRRYSWDRTGDELVSLYARLAYGHEAPDFDVRSWPVGGHAR